MYQQSEKNLLSSNISSPCPHNMVNFGPLAAEIFWRVWAPLQISTSFASWQRYCTAFQYWASDKLCGVEQRAPPIFGRVAITLGIGPHSSCRWYVHTCNHMIDVTSMSVTVNTVIGSQYTLVMWYDAWWHAVLKRHGKQSDFYGPIIFFPVVSSSFFFFSLPNLSRRSWLSAILPHMVWP